MKSESVRLPVTLVVVALLGVGVGLTSCASPLDPKIPAPNDQEPEPDEPDTNDFAPGLSVTLAEVPPLG